MAPSSLAGAAVRALLLCAAASTASTAPSAAASSSAPPLTASTGEAAAPPPLTAAPAAAAPPAPLSRRPSAAGFREAVARQLGELGVNASVEVERRRVLNVAGDKVVGFGVTLRGLSDAHSLTVQYAGIGGRQRFGCGVFLPRRKDDAP